MDFPYPPGVRRNRLNNTSSSESFGNTAPEYSSNFNYNGATSTQSIKRENVPDALRNKKYAKKDNIRKVQVAADEKATQRVQVNAGYENPEIVCSGESCSGIFLRYGLTLHGTSDGA